MQRVPQEKAKARLPGGEQRARLRSSPAELASPPSTVWLVRHGGDARAPGATDRSRTQAPFSGVRPTAPAPSPPAPGLGPSS